MPTFSVTTYWVAERVITPPTYVDVNGQWWLCVSHWGPVYNTGLLVVEVV